MLSRLGAALMLSSALFGAEPARAAQIPLGDAVGQRIITGYHGARPTASVLDAVRKGRAGGVILFGENVSSPAAARAAVRSLQRAAKAGHRPPLLTMVDQEGGDVRRLPTLPPRLSPAQIGASRTPQATAEQQGRRTGKALRGLGINVDLAPVADVAGAKNSFLGTRTFSASPAVVADGACGFASGLAQAGVAPTLKHFPGLGRAPGNTDLAPIIVRAPQSRLAADLEAYRRCAKTVPLVMISSASYPALGIDRPASLDARTYKILALTGFTGLTITDAFTTPAIAGHAHAARSALRAGADLLLYGPDEAPAQRAYTRLRADASAGVLSAAALRADAARVIAFKQQLARGTARAAAASEPVVFGVERLDSPDAAVLRGKRVGLIANAASVTRDGTPAWRALQAHGIRVRRLFAPEHGLSGKAGAGVRQGDGVDRESGLPVVSLYGDHLQPTAHDLEGLDALVFDLQEAGVRFFTYSSTEILALQAAAKAGVPFVVLDRPDPLGGDRVAGPSASGRRSFVSLAPGPLVNGLTAGELARYANARLARPARLTVVPMTGWRRAMTWPQTGRRWVPPSPNLRTADAALLYPGTGLLEATNVSEGRGTSAPFQTICAPWLDPAPLLRLTIAGVELRRATVRPKASAAAPDPKYARTRCRGVHVSVSDPAVDGYRVGLALLRALRRAPRFAWQQGGAGIDTAVGTPRVRAAIDRGVSTRAILAADARTAAAWRRARKPYLLYE